MTVVCILSNDQRADLGKRYMAGVSVPVLAKDFGVSMSTICNMNKRAGLWRPRGQYRHRTNTAAYQTRPVSDEAAYWAGFVLADGWVRKKYPTIHLNLAVKDIEHVSKFRDFIMPTGEVRMTHQDAGVVARIYGVAALLPCLERFGIVEHKSSGHPIPDVDDCEFWPFVRGFFDGDGCIGHYHQKGGTRFYWHVIFVGRENFMRWLRTALTTRGIQGGSLTNKGGLWRFAYVGSSAVNLASHLLGSPCLDRKAELLKRAAKENL